MKRRVCGPPIWLAASCQCGSEERWVQKEEGTRDPRREPLTEKSSSELGRFRFFFLYPPPSLRTPTLVFASELSTDKARLCQRRQRFSDFLVSLLLFLLSPFSNLLAIFRKVERYGTRRENSFVSHPGSKKKAGERHFHYLPPFSLVAERYRIPK